MLCKSMRFDSTDLGSRTGGIVFHRMAGNRYLHERHVKFVELRQLHKGCTLLAIQYRLAVTIAGMNHINVFYIINIGKPTETGFSVV